MINVYSVVEDLMCTELHHYEDELRDQVSDCVTDFLNGIDDEVEFQWLSDQHLEILDEEGNTDEDLESDLQDLIDEVYVEFVEEYEVDDEDEEE